MNSIDFSTPRAQVALAQAVACAQHKYPDATGHAQIMRGVALILRGAVTLHEGYALVQSQSESGVQHRTNGSCTCQAFVHGNPFCSHRWAVALLRRAQAIAATLPEPICWVADYHHKDGVIRGIAEEWKGVDDHFFFSDVTGQPWGWVSDIVTVLGDLTERSQFVTAMRAVPVQECTAF